MAVTTWLLIGVVEVPRAPAQGGAEGLVEGLVQVAPTLLSVVVGGLLMILGTWVLDVRRWRREQRHQERQVARAILADVRTVLSGRYEEIVDSLRKSAEILRRGRRHASAQPS